MTRRPLDSDGAGETAGAIVPPDDAELNPPVEILVPKALRSPLVLSSPHSGSVYPASFLAAARLDALALRRSEDAHVDALFAGAQAVGAPLLKALFPRAFLDVNREPFELDPRMFSDRLPAFVNTRSMRVAGGLGTIARIVGESQEIYRGKMTAEAGLRRIASLYQPYHGALMGLMEQAHQGFGMAVLVDCHSMPSLTAASGGSERIRADFVLGDRYGTSCDPLLMATAESELRRLGYVVQRNKPYAGGFITEHYGQPARNAHALQIEVNRALYMNETTLERVAGFDSIVTDIEACIAALSDAALDIGSARHAAE